MAIVGGSINPRTGRPNLPVFGGLPGLTYPQFVASVTAKATGGSKGQDAVILGGGTGFGNFIVPLSPTPAMTMTGSPWSSVFAGGVTRYGTVARHGYPSQTPYTENVASSRTVYMVIEYVDERDTFTALDRNGFLSDGYAAGAVRSAYRVTLFAWWDAALGKPQQSPSYIGGAPVDYVP